MESVKRHDKLLASFKPSQNSSSQSTVDAIFIYIFLFCAINKLIKCNMPVTLFVFLFGVW